MADGGIQPQGDHSSLECNPFSERHFFFFLRCLLGLSTISLVAVAYSISVAMVAPRTSPRNPVIAGLNKMLHTLPVGRRGEDLKYLVSVHLHI